MAKQDTTRTSTPRWIRPSSWRISSAEAPPPMASPASAAARYNGRWRFGFESRPRRQTAVLESNHGPVSAVGFSKDGLCLACGTSKGALVVYDLPIQREVALLAGHEKKIYSVAFLDENTLASASLDRVTLWQGR